MSKKKQLTEKVIAPEPSWGQVATPEPGIESDWNAPTAELEQDARWDGGSEQPAAETEPTQDDWNSVPVQPARSHIFVREHAGKFDPSIVKMLVYGESGTGKTRLASTFPDVLFLDIDKGMSSVTEVVDAVDIDNFHQLEEVYEFLKNGEHSYGTVVIDTLNEMQRIAMRATVTDFPAIRRSYDDLPSMSDYGKMLHEFSELVQDFTHLPMRVVLLAQVTSRQFDTDVLQPQLVGKNSAREVARKMDVIGYIEKSEHEDQAGHKLAQIVFDAPNYVVKDRSFALPPVLVDPSYSRIASHWK
jgi:hypothetical protein